MSASTIDTKAWHAIYQDLPAADRLAINEAFDVAREVLKDRQPTSNVINALPLDDGAENLIAALTFYAHGAPAEVPANKRKAR